MDNDILLSDDLHPSPGIYVPEVADEVREEINHEKNMMLAAAPMIDSILEWFNDQIAHLNTLDGIELDKDLQLQVYGRKYAADRLTEAKSNLETMRDSYLKKQGQ